MKSYKEKIKRRLLTARGNLNDDLTYGENEEFDLEICRSCSRWLSDMELMVFVQLFRCVESYKGACQIISRCKEQNYQVNTIVKYSNRVIERMVHQVHRDKRLAAWIDRHREQNPK